MDYSKTYESPKANVIKFDKEGMTYIYTSGQDGGHFGGNPRLIDDDD